MGIDFPSMGIHGNSMEVDGNRFSIDGNPWEPSVLKAFTMDFRGIGKTVPKLNLGASCALGPSHTKPKRFLCLY